MNSDIVINKDWTNEINAELLKLNADWISVIDMTKESIEEFQKKGGVVGMVETLTMLLEYNEKTLIFEEKVRALNESNGDVTWQ